MYGVRVLLFNATFNNISAILSWSVLLVEETRVPGANHRPAASHWQTSSHNIVSSTRRLNEIRTHNVYFWYIQMFRIYCIICWTLLPLFLANWNIYIDIMMFWFLELEIAERCHKWQWRKIKRFEDSNCVIRSRNSKESQYNVKRMRKMTKRHNGPPYT